MAEEMSAADIAAVTRPNIYGGYGVPYGGYNDGFGFGSGGLWLFAILAMMMFGNGGFGFGNSGFSNSIGYDNLATANDVQRGFDNQNTMANEREILAAVTNGTTQAVAATNQSFHDTLSAIQDKYGEIARDIYGVTTQVQQSIANQAQCCSDTKMLVAETGAGLNASLAQNRYENALNTSAINANTTAQTQKILDAIAQNKIDALQGRVQQLELDKATAGVLRYPNAWTYNAGASPFCNGGAQVFA